MPAAFRKRNVGFVLHADPDEDFLRFCADVHPWLVIGDENPSRGAELAKARIAAELQIPFWTVDADLIVPSRMAREGTLCSAQHSA